MFSVQWRLVNFVTIVLYIVIILFLPFKSVTSTVFLFALVAFWSRLPGVGTPPPGEWLMLFDVVDIFSIIVAINISGLSGALFSIIINIGSRIVGSFPDWITIMKDAVAQFIVCFIIPYVYLIVGRNIIVTTIWYSILRLLVMLPMRFFYAKYPFPQAMVMIIGGGILLTFVNSFYAGLFGNFFDNLLKEGVKFNWLLFLFVTLVIGGTKVYFKLNASKNI